MHQACQGTEVPEATFAVLLWPAKLLEVVGVATAEAASQAVEQGPIFHCLHRWGSCITGCRTGGSTVRCSAQVGVLQWFARLWEIDQDDYWGYITNCGTEGNLHGILVGRENLPDGILYASHETHYSVFKAARMYRMDSVKVRAT